MGHKDTTDSVSFCVVGNKYEVDYYDHSYPCDCECHTSHDILHIEACCYNMSYAGLAECFLKIDEDWYGFKIPNGRRLKLHISSVIREVSSDYKNS
jgi:hypothetical protein